MLSRATSSDHLPPATLSDSGAIEKEQTAPTQKSVAALRSFFTPSLSKEHALLLAAAEKAKNHFQSLPATEKKSSPVTEKIIENERWAARNSAANAGEARSESIPVINALRYQCTDQKLLSTVAELESRLQHASEQAAKSTAHATSATQKQTVQIDTKSAALHAADARLALAQLHQLEPQRSSKSPKKGEADLKKAETDYQNASHELTALLKTTAPSFQIVTDDDDSSVDEEEQQDDFGNGTWRDVSDEEALRRVEVDKMSNEDRCVKEN